MHRFVALHSIAIAAILFGQCLISMSTTTSTTNDLYKSFCKGKKNAQVTSVSQINDLAKLSEQFTEDPVECSELIRNSIKSLNDAVTKHSDDICSKKKADLMRNFYVEHVDNKKNKAPKALRKFFAAYGMRLSFICRQRMVESINESQKVLNEKDFEFVKDWTSDDGPIGRMLSDPNDYENLIVPENLGLLLKSGQEQTFIKVSTKNRFDEMKVFCQRRLEPIYGKLISPIITLNNIGFNYQGENFPSKDSVTNKLVYQWYRIVFACENLKNIVLAFDVTLNPVETENAPSRMVQILTKEEVQDKLREGDKTWLAAMEEEKQGIRRYPEIEQIKYKPTEESVFKSDKVGDLILDSSDKKLMYAVSHYKPHYKQSVSKLISNALKFLKNSKSKSKITDTTQLMVALNDYQHSLENTDSQGVACENHGKIRGKHDNKIFFGLLAGVVAIATVGLLVAKTTGHDLEVN